MLGSSSSSSSSSGAADGHGPEGNAADGHAVALSGITILIMIIIVLLS